MGRFLKEKNHVIRHVAGGVSLLALSMSLVACGSSTHPASSSQSTAKAGSAGAAPLQKVTFAVFPSSTPSLPIFAAAGLGYFKRNGLDVTLDNVSTGAASAQAAAAGSVQFYISTIPTILNLDDKGIDTEAVVQLYNNFPQALYCRNSVKMPADHSFTSVFKALHNVSVGITAPGSLTWEVMLYGEEAAGLSSNWANLVSVGSSSSAIAAFQKGSIDCVIAYEPMQHQLDKMHLGTPVLNWQDHQGPQIYNDYSFTQVAATPSYISGHRAAVQAVINSISQAETFVNNPANAAAVTAAIMPYFNGMTAATLQDIVSSEISHDVSPKLSATAVQNAEKEATAIHEVTSTKPINQIVASIAPQ